MKCCVIGGAGFIGSQLVSRLTETGRDVVVIGNKPTPAATLPKSVAYISCDYGDSSPIHSALEDASEVIHLAYATQPQTSYTDPIFDIIGNLPPMITLLEAARDRDIRRMIIISSGGTVYGPVERLPISEDFPTNPISPYGITKLTIEKYSMMFFHFYSLPVIIIRPSNAYGTGQRPFNGQGFIATAIGSILKGKDIMVYGEHGTIRDYIHVSDVCNGIIAALDQGQPGEIYNVGSGIGLNNLEVLEIISGIAEKRNLIAKIKFMPSRIFDVPANILDCKKLSACSAWKPSIPISQGIMEMWKTLEPDSSI